jgi:hypothetical protein
MNLTERRNRKDGRERVRVLMMRERERERERESINDDRIK